MTVDYLELVRLLLCGIGTTWVCPAPVFDTWMIGGRPVLDTGGARAWSCATDVGGGWIDDIPVVRGVTHDGGRYVLIGGEVLIERDAARPKSAPALPAEVRVVEAAETGHALELVEWDEGAGRRSWHVVTLSEAKGHVELGRELLVRVAAGGAHGFGPGRRLERDEGWPSAGWWDAHGTRESRIERVQEGARLTSRCTPLEGGAEGFRAVYGEWLGEGRRRRAAGHEP